MKPHQQTKWYAILTEGEKAKVDHYTDKWPHFAADNNKPYDSFRWNCTIEGEQYWLDRSIEERLKQKGEISPSMGVNTKPAHKLTWNGYWIDFDPKMPRHVFEHLRDLINKEK